MIGFEFFIKKGKLFGPVFWSKLLIADNRNNIKDHPQGIDRYVSSLLIFKNKNRLRNDFQGVSCLDFFRALPQIFYV